MADDNKILTVSYGTFSCTLEGFDDPFNAMRSIAEYFRDLAADDRYFGAEPPTPDPAMLHSLAQEQIQRRVETRVSENGVTLRQTDEPVSNPAPAKPTKVETHAKEAAKPQTAEPTTAQAAASEDIASKLQRIRDAVQSRSDMGYTDEQPLGGDAVPETSSDVAVDKPARKPSKPIMPEVVVKAPQTAKESAPKAPKKAAPAPAEKAAAKAPAAEAVDKAADVPTDASDDAAVMAAVSDAAANKEEPQQKVTDAPATADDASAPESKDVKPTRPVRARVVKLRRSDLEKSLDGTADVAAEKAAPVEKAPEPLSTTENLREELGSSTLDPDEERDLMDELASIIDDDQDGEKYHALARPMAGPLDDYVGIEPVDVAARLRDTDTNIFAQSDADVGRLMDETNREMAKDDTVRRRNAIEHLKAAVSSVLADKESKDGIKVEATDEDQYKQDLAQADRPAALQPAEAPVEPEQELPPLMLVSENRVEDESQAAPEAVMPQRPQPLNLEGGVVPEADDDDAVIEVENFADFAQQTGAHTLDDVLEAATAYANLVLDHESVTRPQIMELASEALGEQTSVEDGLRSFGQLLRQGKIAKVKRGEFAVSETSRYRNAS